MTRNLFDDALVAEGVDQRLAAVARSIYKQESGGGKNTKTSNAGAVGGMQILPGTFAGVADKGWDINNPEHNLRAGIRYLKQLDKQAGGDPVLTAAGYYGGPGGLEKARRGIAVSDPRNPKAPNTLQYGQQVAARLGTPAYLAQSDQDFAKMPTPVVQVAQAPEVAAPVATETAPVVVAQAEPVVPAPVPVVQETAAVLPEVVAQAQTRDTPVHTFAPYQNPDFMAALGNILQRSKPNFQAFGTFGNQRARG